MLVAVSSYRSLTGDLVTEDDAVTAALTQAQGYIEAAIDRALDYGDHVETIPAYVDEWTPRALPVASLVDHGDVLTVGPERLSVVRGSVTAYGDLPGPFWGSDAGDFVTFHYLGGYQSEAELPPRLRLEWCLLARRLIRDEQTREERPPSWVSSVTNGDVAMSVRAEASVSYIDDMRSVLSGFRRQ